MVDTDAVDQRASNGVIHVMDKVIYPIPSGDVTTVATSNPDFSTLVTALEKADLVDTLKGKIRHPGYSFLEDIWI